MNHTEMFIARFYESINVEDPNDLSIESLSDRTDLRVHFWDLTSAIVRFKGECKVFINEKLNERQQWQDFGHEMGHYFWHGGRKLYLTNKFVEYQEVKADYFSYHFCVPTFMLTKLKGLTVYDVMNLFNVEFDFALRRLEMYKNKILENKIVYERAYY